MGLLTAEKGAELKKVERSLLASGNEDDEGIAELDRKDGEEDEEEGALLAETEARAVTAEEAMIKLQDQVSLDLHLWPLQ